MVGLTGNFRLAPFKTTAVVGGLLLLWRLRAGSSESCWLSRRSLLSLPSAKQKLEDRLAAAAREKLAQASKESKEKQLQAERKRKAALFLQTLKNPAPEAELGKVEESPFTAEVRPPGPASALGAASEA